MKAAGPRTLWKVITMIAGYGDASLVYDERGWRRNFPLPVGEKFPPPKGYTGREAKVPSSKIKKHWRMEQPDGNLGLHIRDGLVVVDIDNYAKGERPAGAGLATIKAVQERADCMFPPTWALRNRDDGSEKRFYRVPKGRSWRSGLGAGVDLVHSGQRYVVAWPSRNPVTGKVEQWFDPNGCVADLPPMPTELARLPEALVEELARDGARDCSPLATDSVAHELIRALPTGVMAQSVHNELQAALNDLSGGSGSRHDRTRWHVRTLVEYGHWGAGGADSALQLLRGQFVEATQHDSSRGTAEVAEAEFDRLVLHAGKVIGGKQYGARDRARNLKMLQSLEPGGVWHPDTPKPWSTTEPKAATGIFKLLGPCQWAQPVPEPNFLIGGALCEDTFGVNAGPKKSLKTHDNQAIALAIASGENLYLDDRFPVKRAARVLYVVGEGGEVPVRRTLRRMARAYGLRPDDIAEDPDFPLTVAFGAAPMNAKGFKKQFLAMLDAVQPEVVLLESFYNFHPSDVDGGNLYQRGQKIDGFHKYVREQCTGAVSLITDHYRSTGTSKSLDLDSVSMAGQAENADSWILRHHRTEPDVSAGEFHLQVGFNSRQWGGTIWNIDWHLGVFDPELGHHDGEISWDVSAPESGARSADIPEHKTTAGRRRLILDYIDAHPETSKTAACEVLASEYQGAGEKNFRAAWTALENEKFIEQVEKLIERKHGSGTRQVTAKVWRRGNKKVKFAGRDGADDAEE